MITTGKINQSSSGIFDVRGWQLIHDIQVAGPSATELTVINGDSIGEAHSKAVTAFGTAAISSAQYKFPDCPFSIFLDGNSDYLSLADSSDYYFANNDFTIDFWIYFNSVSGVQTFAGQTVNDNSDRWFIQKLASGELQMYFQSGGVVKARYDTHVSAGLVAGQWYHMAFTRNGTNGFIFLNGVALTCDISQSFGTDVGDLAANLLVGTYYSTGSSANINYVNGYLNFFRIRKLVATWTSNFTPPQFIGDPNGDYGTQFTKLGFSVNGDVDEEYKLIVRDVSGYSGTTSINVRLNNDSGSNYSEQQLFAQSTASGAGRNTTDSLNRVGVGVSLGQVSLAEMNIYAKSGYIRTAIAKETSGAAGTTVNQISLFGNTWNNSTDNISSIVVFADQINGLGAGTHIFLFAKRPTAVGLKIGSLNPQGNLNVGAMQLVERYEVTGSAATSKTFSGLDGNTDILYEIKVRHIGVGNYSSRLLMNNDSGDNYGAQLLNATNTTITAARYTTGENAIISFSDPTAAGDLAISRYLIYARSGFGRSCIVESTGGISGTTVKRYDFTGQIWNNTTDNITSIVVNAFSAGGMGVGTVIELWALRKKI